MDSKKQKSPGLKYSNEKQSFQLKSFVYIDNDLGDNKRYFLLNDFI